jgi:hypothetical protein
MKFKVVLLFFVLPAIAGFGQEYVQTITSIPENNANNAQGEKCAIWRNSERNPTTSDNFPNDNNNWWSIFQTQFHDVRYDAQIAFGLNTQDMWLRFNYMDTWKPWRKVFVANDLGEFEFEDDVYINTGIDDNHIYWGQHNMTMGTKPGAWYHNILKLKPGGSSAGVIYSRFEMYRADSESEHVKTIQLHTKGISFFNGGNLLIGKTTQQNSNYKLDVAGTVRANEVKINLDGADFVFEPDYKLLPLNDLERFVKENKHLPDVVPAKEMEANGANLGELNTVLLQKIEELTLYIIEQNKRIENLENKLEKSGI